MKISAADGNTKAPPFMCKAKEFDGGKEIYPGYYDSVDNVVIQSKWKWWGGWSPFLLLSYIWLHTPFFTYSSAAYANTVGRTDVEGCCYWGRGVLLTRGRCLIGKLDAYLGQVSNLVVFQVSLRNTRISRFIFLDNLGHQGAVEREVFVFPDIHFCSDPGAICNHPRTNELRWVLGLLEWADRVQSYVDSNTGWSYIDQLKQFVDEGMVDDAFINGVINIFTRQCHDDSCENQWKLDEDNNVFEATRRANFRKIIFEVFNLPMTYRPTQFPTLDPTWPPTAAPTVTASPTASPTSRPTSRPTRKRKNVELINLETSGACRPAFFTLAMLIGLGVPLLN